MISSSCLPTLSAEERRLCSKSFTRSAVVLVEATVKTFFFLEELLTSAMNALHLVGNPAFGRALDTHGDSVGRVWKYHFVLVLSP